MMKFIYQLDHIYTLANHIEAKRIGVFSTEENAKIAIQSVQNKPGFRDHPTDFKIRKRWYFIRPRLLDKIYWG